MSVTPYKSTTESKDSLYTHAVSIDSPLTCPSIRMDELRSLVAQGDLTAKAASYFASDPKPRPKPQGQPYYPYGVSIRNYYIKWTENARQRIQQELSISLDNIDIRIEKQSLIITINEGEPDGTEDALRELGNYQHAINVDGHGRFRIIGDTVPFSQRPPSRPKTGEEILKDFVTPKRLLASEAK